MAVFRDDDLVRRDRGDFSTLNRQKNGVRIARNLCFQTSADERRFRNNQRNALALHV